MKNIELKIRMFHELMNEKFSNKPVIEQVIENKYNGDVCAFLNDSSWLTRDEDTIAMHTVAMMNVNDPEDKKCRVTWRTNINSL